ncbi:hypothetical protein IT407_04855 [Candidatus Uhrbacteria bacterium]|nr:hypothetical protein [Candidatus Uhrbacteria bacterium]
MSIFGLLVTLAILWFFARYFGGIGIGAPWLPVRRRDIADAFALAQPGSDDTVIDLGSGDGRLLLESAKKGAAVIGYELNPILVWISRIRLKSFASRSVIHRQNLLDADLSKATIIYIFGIGPLMPKLSKKIQKECRAGVKIISFAFELPGMQPVQTKGVVHLYIR